MSIGALVPTEGQSVKRLPIIVFLSAPIIVLIALLAVVPAAVFVAIARLIM
jgi:hypothetical protein